MEKEVIQLRMFKDFTVTYQGVEVELSKHMGKQLINLFQIFALNAGNEIPRETLIDILWPENDDPRNVMKFTIFRLRKDLDKIDALKGLDLVQTTKNGYMLSDKYIYESDFSEFESIYKAIDEKEEINRRDYKEGLRLMDLYAGRLYTTSAPSLHVSQLVEYYRSAYASTVLKMCKYLIANEEYERMLSINYKAIVIEPFYEGLHYYYMKGLIETRDYHRALKYYDDTNEAFYRELGTGLSPRFKELYDAIIEDEEDDEVYTIQELQQDLLLNSKKEGGFYCAYDMFKYLYEISLKSSKRENRKYFVILLELSNKTLNIDKETAVMNRLKQIIGQSLRVNDIFTKINNTQYGILVSCHELENVYIIVQRITSQFYKRYSSTKYRLNYNAIEASAEFE